MYARADLARQGPRSPSPPGTPTLCPYCGHDRPVPGTCAHCGREPASLAWRRVPGGPTDQAFADAVVTAPVTLVYAAIAAFFVRGGHNLPAAIVATLIMTFFAWLTAASTRRTLRGRRERHWTFATADGYCGRALVRAGRTVEAEGAIDLTSSVELHRPPPAAFALTSSHALTVDRYALRAAGVDAPPTGPELTPRYFAFFFAAIGLAARGRASLQLTRTRSVGWSRQGAHPPTAFDRSSYTDIALVGGTSRPSDPWLERTLLDALARQPAGDAGYRETPERRGVRIEDLIRHALDRLDTPDALVAHLRDDTGRRCDPDAVIEAAVAFHNADPDSASLLRDAIEHGLRDAAERRQLRTTL